MDKNSIKQWTHVRGDPKWLGGDRWKTTLHMGIEQGRQVQRTRNFEAVGIKRARIEQARVLAALRAERTEEAKHRGTVADLTERWVTLKSRRWSPTTYYNAEKMMARVRADLGAMPAEKLTARHLDEWYDRLLSEGKSSSTVGHFHALLHSMLKQAHKWGDVSGNVADLASPPARGKRTKTHDTPTVEALKVLIDSAPPDLLLAARLSAGIGCRRGEVVGLRWSDIDGGNVVIRRNMIKVPGAAAAYKSTKTHDERTLRLDEHLAVMLIQHRAEQVARFVALELPVPADGPVFLNWRGTHGPTPRPPDWITKAWTRLCDRHGVSVRFHALRHFTATNLLGGGHSLADVAQQLGHADPAVTARVYAHALPNADSATATTMGDLLGLPHQTTA